jgi:hypothetical protein
LSTRSTLDVAAIAAERARRGAAVIKLDAHGREIYEPDGRVLTQFATSNNRVDIVQGPIGSGKTNAMFRRLGRHAMQQAPSPRDGLRKTRWAVIRNTFPELKRTTIKTWRAVWPVHLYGEIKMGSPPRHDIAFGDVRIEVDFLALDTEDDIAKLRSADYTGIAVHECQYIQLEIFREARSRTNRYPEESEGGATWHGVIADANAPDEDHWLAIMTGQVELPEHISLEDRRALTWPSNWGFFSQPPAVLKIRNARGEVVRREINLDAENLRWLASDYYVDLLDGNPPDWIDNRLGNETILVIDGSPVWPMFRRDFHVAKEPLRPVPGHDVLVALDFGRVFPAALFGQEVNGRINIQYEMLGFNQGATVFAPLVKRFLETHYAGHTFRCSGDPKGRDKGQATEQSAYDVFAAHGMPVTPAPVKANDIDTRIEAVAYALNDNPSGVNRLVISPLCRTLIVGMAGRYHLVREEDGELRPKKDKYSNLCDALQYLCISLGEGQRMIGLSSAAAMKPAQVYKGRRSMRRGMPDERPPVDPWSSPRW